VIRFPVGLDGADLLYRNDLFSIPTRGQDCAFLHGLSCHNKPSRWPVSGRVRTWSRV